MVQHVTGWTNTASGQKCLVSRASRHVEYTVAGPKICQIKHPFCRWAIGLTTLVLQTAPPLCTLIPLCHNQSLSDSKFKISAHPYIDCWLCYEGTNITEERVVNHLRTQLNDVLIAP